MTGRRPGPPRPPTVDDDAVTRVHDRAGDAAAADDAAAVAAMLPALDGAPGPARRLAAARSRAMVAAILEQAAMPAAGDGAEGAADASVAASVAASVDVDGAAPAAPGRVDIAPARAGAARSARAPRRVAVLVAAIVFGSIGVAAAAWVATRPAAPPAAPAPVSPPAPAAHRAPPAADAPAVDDDVAADEPVADDVDVEIEPLTTPAPRPRHAAPVEVADDDPPPSAPVADVLARANQRRKQRRWRDAAALYERVRAEHPGTDAAVVATVAAAALRLDHLGDPAGARRRYQAALRDAPTGPLAEEARWGVAEAARALGDDAGERAALRAFLAAHADSASAAAARRRLAELDREAP